MKELIDFTNCKEEINEYKGSEKKKTLIFNEQKYLVKFPDPLRQKNKNLSYINNAFSEYIGSHIFEIIGFNTQKTLLGKYIINEKEKIVCACEDFTSETKILYEFENLTNSTMVEKKVDTEIEDIINVIKENENIIDVQDTIKNFWRMFIVDSLIGNTDRHNGNWGFIKDKITGNVYFSPIYDCGSCLNPLLEDSDLQKIDETEFKNLALNCYSCLKENGKKITGNGNLTIVTASSAVTDNAGNASENKILDPKDIPNKELNGAFLDDIVLLKLIDDFYQDRYRVIKVIKREKNHGFSIINNFTIFSK